MAYYDLSHDKFGNLTDDYDGDGLKNGEEISVVCNGGKYYVYLKSNPLTDQSDSDCIDDYTEVINGSNPLRFSVEKKYVDQLENDSLFLYENRYTNTKEQISREISLAVSSEIMGVWNKKELYRDLIIDYYCNYATIETLENQTLTEQKRIWTDSLISFLDGLKDVSEHSTEWYEDIREVQKLVGYVRGVTDDSLLDEEFVDQVVKMVSKYHSVSEEARKIRCDSYRIKYTKRILDSQTVTKAVTKSTEALEKVTKVVSWIGIGVDIGDTILKMSKINANCAVFQENMDELDYLINYSEDKYAREAAGQVKEILAGKLSAKLSAVLDDASEAAGQIIIDKIAESNIYVFAVVAAKDIVDVLLGMSEDIEQEYNIFCYHELSNACSYNLNKVLSDDNQYYQIESTQVADYYRYMIHLTQIRILGEKMYYELKDCGGLLGPIFDEIVDLASIRRDVQERINLIKKAAVLLDLYLSHNLEYEV